MTASVTAHPTLPADLVSLDQSFLRLSEEIVRFQLPRLSSCISSSDLSDYEAELNSCLESLKRIVVDLELSIDECETISDRQHLSKLVQSHKQTLESTRQSIRRSILTNRQRLVHLRTMEARKGLQLVTHHAKQQTGAKVSSIGDDKLMTTSQDVTDRLRRTVELMSSELEKSAISSQLLEESSQTMSTVSNQYGSLSMLMTNSVNLIKTMEREDLIGKGLVLISMLFFLSCVGYILYVRVISKGVGLVGFTVRMLGLGRILGGGSRSVQHYTDKNGSLLSENGVSSSMATAATAVVVGSSVLSAVAAAAVSQSSKAPQILLSDPTPTAQSWPINSLDQWDQHQLDEENKSETEQQTILQHITTHSKQNTRPTQRIEL